MGNSLFLTSNAGGKDIIPDESDLIFQGFPEWHSRMNAAICCQASSVRLIVILIFLDSCYPGGTKAETNFGNLEWEILSMRRVTGGCRAAPSLPCTLSYTRIFVSNLTISLLNLTNAHFRPNLTECWQSKEHNIWKGYPRKEDK